MVYYITISEAPDGHSAYILPLLECTRQYPYLYYLVAITHYLTSKSSKIGC
jgi:hypothetical protein